MEHVAEDLAVTSETARRQSADGVDLAKVQKPVGVGAPKYTNPRRTRAVVTLSVLVVTLVAVTIVSAGLGQYNIPTDQVLSSFARKWGFIPPQQEWAIADSTLWNVRFPRVLLACSWALHWAARGLLCRRCLATRWLSREWLVFLQVQLWVPAWLLCWALS